MATGIDTGALRRDLRVSDLPTDESWPHHEVIDGGLYVTPSAGRAHQLRVADLVETLRTRVPAGLRVVTSPNLVVSDDTLVIPDVAVVAAGEGGGLGWDPSEVFLVVEVLSPSTRRRDLTLKRDLYAQLGFPYWVIDPELGHMRTFLPANAPDWARTTEEGYLP